MAPPARRSADGCRGGPVGTGRGPGPPAAAGAGPSPLPLAGPPAGAAAFPSSRAEGRPRWRLPEPSRPAGLRPLHDEGDLGVDPEVPDLVVLDGGLALLRPPRGATAQRPA